MPGSRWLLVEHSVLPEIFTSVIKAKQLLLSGQAKTASQAAKLAGISRSAFYKYKDSVFSYNEQNGGRIVNIHALLEDKPGVLSKFINELSRAGANILTLNQSIPTYGSAPVSVSARVDELNCSMNELIAVISEIDGVKTTYQVAGE